MIYSDDVVQLIAEADLPAILNVLGDWCKDNLLSINATKSNIVHFRNPTLSLRKHAYSNIVKILPLNNELFPIKNSNIFHISAQNIDCGFSLEPPRRGCSNKYPQSMFLSRNKKNNVYSCKPPFYYTWQKKLGIFVCMVK